MTEKANIPEFDVDVDYDRQREDALREQLYIEAERHELECIELGVEVPYTGPRQVRIEQDELEDIPF